MNSIKDLLAEGLLHSEISGSKFLGNSPELIATMCVLLRYFRPRHPPYALMLSIFWHTKIYIAKYVLRFLNYKYMNIWPSIRIYISMYKING